MALYFLLFFLQHAGARVEAGATPMATDPLWPKKLWKF